ncbi:hypothetical protein Taro_051042 [Colocasia esculenta]|uniref:Uncharacterized protein n=1 Tax=Colocasia esculenta TaxID=4460 RepID=A0A843XEY6_COLES|nr:hypothetical protein [Colocasia esculenta]
MIVPEAYSEAVASGVDTVCLFTQICHSGVDTVHLWCRHYMTVPEACSETVASGVDTVCLCVDTVCQWCRHSPPQNGAFQILLHLQKLQAILSRGRTWESREISGEKLAVLGKGADPTEEEQ